VEVLPEVRAAAGRLAALADETLDLVQGLEAVSALALVLLPACVGVSITVVVDGDPFTVTATSEDVKVVDGTQYLDGGPCVASSESAEDVCVVDVLDEQRWQLYAQAAASNGIRSSLSMPLRSGSGDAIGALNLYASEAGACAARRRSSRSCSEWT
jgi:GAF domain-containing protein